MLFVIIAMHIVFFNCYSFRLNPNYDQALNNLGNLYKDLRQLDKAESLLQQAVRVR
jgi:tetratricopeptide (TPR) repeat protein